MKFKHLFSVVFSFLVFFICVSCDLYMTTFSEIYSDYKSAKKHCLFNDDKPVEITIEETNQPTQTAIECLKETREYIFNAFMSVQPLLDICNFIENKIKELEEEWKKN